MQKRIIQREYQAERAAALSQYHPILRRIYAARGVVSHDELRHEFDRLLPFESLLDIDKAVILLAEAIVAQKKIMVVGDFDADGATSSALAIRALKSFGAQSPTFMVPNRFALGYGLTPELVQLAVKEKPDLILTVDNGIANHAGVIAAQAFGIKVIITDHHLQGQTLPPADAIVNPNRAGDPFPSKNLAGVGVIFYVMLALRRYLKAEGWFARQNLSEPNMARLLDLVALGTVADLVPLDANNRILVHQGIKRIRAGLCTPGILSLLEIANKDFTRVTTADLGFLIAARLNAAGRLVDMSLGIECLLSDDSYAVREMAQTLNRLNNERRVIEKSMHTQALSALDQLQGTLKGRLPRGICLYDESWHQGVIGILASRIKEKFNRPVIVFAKGQAGELKGSARSVSGVHIRDTLAHIATTHPALIAKFGGHAMAAGLTISTDVLNNFVSIFDDAVSKVLTELQLEHTLLSDGNLQAEDLNLDVASALREGGPWGQAFPEPLFDNTFRLLDQRLVGEKHLKLRLQIGDIDLDAIAFNVNLNEWPNYRCAKIHAAYRLDVNEYRGRSTVQLIIEHLEMTA